MRDQGGRSDPLKTRRDILATVLFLPPLIALLLQGAWHSSVTVDEPGHLVAGLSYLRSATFSFYKVNPPLTRLIAAAPASMMRPEVDWSKAYSADAASRHEFSFGRHFYRWNADRGRELFFAARVALIPFALLGAVVCFQWSRELFGASAGLLAAGLWCLSPMVLGHGCLVTPDMAAAAVGVAACYTLRIWMKQPGVGLAAAFGCAAGVACCTKFTWLPVIPAAAVILTAAWHGRCFRQMASLRGGCLQAATAIGVCWLVVCAMYEFEGVGTPLGDVELVSRRFGHPDNVHADAYGRAPSPFANRFSETCFGSLPIPIPVNMLQGVDLQQADFEPPYRLWSFLLGEWQKPGWWYFYFVAALFKTPLPTLILIGWACFRLMTGRTRGRSHHQGELQRSIVDTDPLQTRTSPEVAGIPSLRLELLTLLCPPVLLLVLLSSQSGLSMHFRYALPVLPFLAILASAVLHPSASRTRLAAVLALVGWQAFSVLAISPYWLSYFNELAGGPAGGYRILTDSNVDWGQDMWALRDWVQQHKGVEPIYFAGHRTAPPDQFGIEWADAAPFIAGHPQVTSEDGHRGPRSGWHVISVWSLVGGGVGVMEDGKRIGGYSYYERYTPVATIGYSMRIYHFSDDEAAAAVHELLAEEQRIGNSTAVDSG